MSKRKCKNRNCGNGRWSDDDYRPVVESGRFRLRCNGCGRLQTIKIVTMVAVGSVKRTKPAEGGGE